MDEAKTDYLVSHSLLKKKKKDKRKKKKNNTPHKNYVATSW